MHVRPLHSMPCTHQAAGPACAWTNVDVNPRAVVLPLQLFVVKTLPVD